MIQTSLPELNEILGGGFPDEGISVIVGTPRSGKTMLVGNIASVVVRDLNSRLAIVTEEAGSAWANMVLRDRTPDTKLASFQMYRSSVSLVHDIRNVTLIIVDGCEMTAPIQEFARRGPVILTSNERSTDLLRHRSAAVVLQLERVKNEDRVIAKVLKNRTGPTGASVQIKYDSKRGLVEHEVPAPTRWDVLMGEDII